MKSIKFLFVLLTTLFSYNLYSSEIYQASCNEPSGSVSIWNFDTSLTEQEPIGGFFAYDVILNDESFSMFNDYEGQQQFFEFYFEGPNAGLIFRDGGSLNGFSCEWEVMSASASSSESSFDSSKPHVLVELISYEDKKDYEEKPYCEMEFTFTNNSFGTLYEMNIETESFDDRGDKLDDYGFNSKIKAFGDFWSMEEEMKLGNSATSKSLSLKTKCQYVQDIYITEVKDKYCNIRMLPEETNCLDLVVPNSKIDHINLLFR